MLGETMVAVIPAYEPGVTLLSIAQEIRKKKMELIIVDDGSGCEYDDLFHRLREFAHVIRYPENRGKGHALKTAFSYLSGDRTGQYSVVLLDCDGQHSVEDAFRLAELAGQDRGALFLGSRRQSSDSPVKSRLGNAITRLVFRATSGVGIYETQTGLRAFSSELLPVMLEIPGERYEYEMNMLMRFAEEGIPMIEEPVQTIYIDNNSGSHFHALRDSARIYWEILKFSGSSLLSFLVDYVLYSVLLMSLGGAAAANILARAISSVVNFTINRKYVFHHEEPVIRSAVKYFALAAGILACNTILLMLLVKAGVNAFLAKIVTEILLFVISYLMQKRVVFRKKQAVKERAVA